MSDVPVKVEPSHAELRPGESVDVVVSVEPTKGGGRVIFPVRGSGGNGRGILELDVTSAVVFVEPRTEPEHLPVDVELIEKTGTSATYRVTARAPELDRKERKRLSRG